jgi:predicted nuclease of restriction endonuclease-like (RecB) superfamily
MAAPALAGSEKVATLSPESGKVATVSPLLRSPEPESEVLHKPLVPADKILQRLSYSHIELLLELDDHLIRTFYEIECIKGGWSVRELKRQIGSLYFERSGLSKDKDALSRMANEAAETQTPALIIRDPFVFDFLGIPAAQAMSESELEDALMNHLQAFLLELGRGFCFEARQKRILIGGEHFFCDLVFYHRLLKCHVLVELKVDEFRHEHLGQLNTYVAWYRENEMQPGDQPPVGILLCTRHNGDLVHYALAGMDQRLFVSRYQTHLPDAKELETFVKQEIQAWENEHS